MTKLVFPICAFAALLILLAAPASAGTGANHGLSADTVSLIADDWCPYTCDERASPGKPGFMIEIAKEIFEKNGFRVEYVLHPWTRSIEEVRAGEHTGLVGASREDVPGFILSNTPVARMVNAFFVKTDSAWNYTDLDSLEKISLGATGEYSYGSPLDAYINQHKNNMRRVQLMTGENPLDLNVQKLLADRVGAVVESTSVMQYYLNANQLTDKIRLAGSLPDSPTADLFIAFGPAHPKARELAELIDRELPRMKADGRHKAILQRYNITE